jgi:tRNA U34 5-methylaminomethyl-2-thiouridine-forming methyltransferase MnmC
MRKEIVITRDGSHAISIPEMNVSYHSVYGAIQESKHVFIDAGFNYLLSRSIGSPIHILEVGFGSGLNVLLTVIEANKMGLSVYYVALEPFPLSDSEFNLLNYCERLERNDLQNDFIKMHYCEWNKTVAVTENILLHKSNHTLQAFECTSKFELIYFDAFDPHVQPELWAKEIFVNLFDLLMMNGFLVTYCSKGDVRRAMIEAGFAVEKLKGPPGKREMLRAIKI